MTSFSDISSNIRQARELSLLGNYESALTFYACGLALIRKHLNSIKDFSKKQQWIQVNHEITQESELVSDINKTLSTFTLDEKLNGRWISDASEEPTRDPGVWPPPPPLEQRRPQPPSSLYAPTSVSSQPRRNNCKEGPRNSGGQVINRGSSKSGPGEILFCIFFQALCPIYGRFFLIILKPNEELVL